MPFSSSPDFLIVGAQKAGTSSLADLMSLHPGISIPKKEIRFFTKYPDKGLEWYRSHFSNEFVAGEATPSYSFMPHVPSSIFVHFPQVKLIWIFRDPVERTFSNYLHSYKKGNEARSFDAAVDDELLNRVTDRKLCYIERSLYIEQILRYQRYFPLDQMLFLTFEDLINHPECVKKHIIDFLNLDDFPPDADLPHSNKTKIPRALPLFRMFNKVFSRHVSSRFRKKIWPHTYAKPAFTLEARERLTEYFQPANDELRKLVGQSFDQWSS